MNPDTHALAGAYAVDAVTDEERRSFEVHLDLCEDCRPEVAELQSAAAAMAVDVELPPPPPMRASVLAAISQTRQLSPLRDEGPGAAEQSSPTSATTPGDAGVSTPETSSSAPVDELAARRRFRVQPWLAAAAAAAVFAVGGAVWQPWEDSSQQLTATEQVLRADDAQRVEQPMGGSKITIVRSPAHKKAVFVADSMPEAPFGKAYPALVRHARPWHGQRRPHQGQRCRDHPAAGRRDRGDRRGDHARARQRVQAADERPGGPLLLRLTPPADDSRPWRVQIVPRTTNTKPRVRRAPELMGSAATRRERRSAGCVRQPNVTAQPARLVLAGADPRAPSPTGGRPAGRGRTEPVSGSGAPKGSRGAPTPRRRAGRRPAPRGARDSRPRSTWSTRRPPRAPTARTRDRHRGRHRGRPHQRPDDEDADVVGATDLAAHDLHATCLWRDRRHRRRQLRASRATRHTGSRVVASG